MGNKGPFSLFPHPCSFLLLPADFEKGKQKWPLRDGGAHVLLEGCSLPRPDFPPVPARLWELSLCPVPSLKAAPARPRPPPPSC